MASEIPWWYLVGVWFGREEIGRGAHRFKTQSVCRKNCPYFRWWVVGKFEYEAFSRLARWARFMGRVFRRPSQRRCDGECLSRSNHCTYAGRWSAKNILREWIRRLLYVISNQAVRLNWSHSRSLRRFSSAVQAIVDAQMSGIWWYSYRMYHLR